MSRSSAPVLTGSTSTAVASATSTGGDTCRSSHSWQTLGFGLSCLACGLVRTWGDHEQSSVVPSAASAGEPESMDVDVQQPAASSGNEGQASGGTQASNTSRSETPSTPQGEEVEGGRANAATSGVEMPPTAALCDAVQAPRQTHREGGTGRIDPRILTAIYEFERDESVRQLLHTYNDKPDLAGLESKVAALASAFGASVFYAATFPAGAGWPPMTRLFRSNEMRAMSIPDVHRPEHAVLYPVQAHVSLKRKLHKKPQSCAMYHDQRLPQLEAEFHRVKQHLEGQHVKLSVFVKPPAVTVRAKRKPWKEMFLSTHLAKDQMRFARLDEPHLNVEESFDDMEALLAQRYDYLQQNCKRKREIHAKLAVAPKRNRKNWQDPMWHQRRTSSASSAPSESVQAAASSTMPSSSSVESVSAGPTSASASADAVDETDLHLELLAAFCEELSAETSAALHVRPPVGEMYVEMQIRYDKPFIGKGVVLVSPVGQPCLVTLDEDHEKNDVCISCLGPKARACLHCTHARRALKAAATQHRVKTKMDKVVAAGDKWFTVVHDTTDPSKSPDLVLIEIKPGGRLHCTRPRCKRLRECSHVQSVIETFPTEGYVAASKAPAQPGWISWSKELGYYRIETEELSSPNALAHLLEIPSAFIRSKRRKSVMPQGPLPPELLRVDQEQRMLPDLGHSTTWAYCPTRAMRVGTPSLAVHGLVHVSGPAYVSILCVWHFARTILSSTMTPTFSGFVDMLNSTLRVPFDQQNIDYRPLRVEEFQKAFFWVTTNAIRVKGLHNQQHCCHPDDVYECIALDGVSIGIHLDNVLGDKTLSDAPDSPLIRKVGSVLDRCPVPGGKRKELRDWIATEWTEKDRPQNIQIEQPLEDLMESIRAVSMDATDAEKEILLKCTKKLAAKMSVLDIWQRPIERYDEIKYISKKWPNLFQQLNDYMGRRVAQVLASIDEAAALETASDAPNSDASSAINEPASSSAVPTPQQQTTTPDVLAPETPLPSAEASSSRPELHRHASGPAGTPQTEVGNPISDGCHFRTSSNGSLRFRGLPTYDKDKKKGEQGCNKDYGVTGGKCMLVLTTCLEHCKIVGWHFSVQEGRKDVHNNIYRHFRVAPKRIYYDFACSAAEYCNNREPVFYRLTEFRIDEFHKYGHTCLGVYSDAPCERNYNTSFNEQRNSTLRSGLGASLSTCSQAVGGALVDVMITLDNYIRDDE